MRHPQKALGVNRICPVTGHRFHACWSTDQLGLFGACDSCQPHAPTIQERLAALNARRGGGRKSAGQDRDSTPRKLFGHDLEAARAAGWRFERDLQGYNGNPPVLYAISPAGYRYRWNGCMAHGGADPWEFVGQNSDECL